MNIIDNMPSVKYAFNNFYGSSFLSYEYAKYYYNKGYNLISLVDGIPPHNLIKYYIPIRDYDIPKDINKFKKNINNINKENKPSIIFCMGGNGRTGMVLAILYKIIYNVSGEQAIKYIRKHYSFKAIETKEQERFIINYEK